MPKFNPYSCVYLLSRQSSGSTNELLSRITASFLLRKNPEFTPVPIIPNPSSSDENLPLPDNNKHKPSSPTETFKRFLCCAYIDPSSSFPTGFPIRESI